MADIVQCTVFLTDIDDSQEMNEAYIEYFPSEPPARTAVAAVAVPGLRPDGDRLHRRDPMREGICEENHV